MNRTSFGAVRASLVGLLLLSFALNICHVWWGLPLSGALAWGTDEVAPLGPLVYAKRTFLDGLWVHKYPAFHFMLLSFAYAPFLVYLFFSGQLSAAGSNDWPYGLSHPDVALTILVLIARMVSAIMGTATVGLIYLIAQRFFGRSSGIFAALFVAFSFPFIYYSHTSNVDVPYLFWFVLALFYYCRLFGEPRSRDYVLLGVCAALAVATKDQAYALMPLLPIPLLWVHLRSLKGEDPDRGLRTLVLSLPWIRYAGVVVAFGVTYVLAANVLNNWTGYVQHVRHIAGPASVPYQQFSPTLSGQVALFRRAMWHLALSLNIPVFAVCASGLLVCLVRFRRVALALLTPVVSYHIFFLSVVLYVYPRFVLPFVVIFAIFGGKLMADLWAVRGRLSWLIRPAIALLLLYSFLCGVSVDWLLQRDPRYQAEEWMLRNVQRTARVEAYGPAQYLPRFPRHMVVDRRELEGSVEEAFRQRTPDYVLLTWVHYRRIVEDDHDDFDQEEFIQRLWDGSLGYRPLADFKAAPFLSPNLIPGLNSRLTVFGLSQPSYSRVDVPKANSAAIPVAGR